MPDYEDDEYIETISDSDDESEGTSDEDMDKEEQVDNPPKDPATNCKILNKDALIKEMNDLIREVSQIVDISNGAIRILLNHFKWNKEIFLERFYECSNVDKFLQGARVAADPSKMGDGVDGMIAECDICCSVLVLTGLPCRHYACKQCWEKYLTTKILVNNTSIIECLYPECKLLIDDEHVLSLIGLSEAARTAFARLSIDGFVASNALLRWCPAVNCGKAVKVSQCEPRVVECACKCRFCFECGGLEGHEPLNCRLLRLWLQKCKDDSETANWISANTKDCPKCQTTIEKNGGCNHMTCRSSSCKNEFCWICMGPWKEHTSNSNCNRYDESKSKQARSDQEKSRAALHRYLHYYNRFMAHKQSLQLENKLHASVEIQMEVMQKKSMSWVEVQFLKKAVNILSECRRTLMNTFAFAFYLLTTNDKEIFEDNQRDLEQATEQLSGFLERDLEEGTDDLVTLKQKVQDKYRYVEQRRLELLKHVSEGAERDAWRFSQ